jgi:hypothetical protein
MLDACLVSLAEACLSSASKSHMLLSDDRRWLRREEYEAQAEAFLCRTSALKLRI